MLRLVSVRTVVCAPWHLRGDLPSCAGDGKHPLGARCHKCAREVALPRSMAAETPICLYCALDEGIIPCEEIAPEDDDL